MPPFDNLIGKPRPPVRWEKDPIGQAADIAQPDQAGGIVDDPRAPEPAPVGKTGEPVGQQVNPATSPPEPDKQAGAAREAAIEQPADLEPTGDTADNPGGEPYTAPIQEARQPEPAAKGGNFFDKFDASAQAGEPGLYERARLSMLDAYYRNTLKGSMELSTLSRVSEDDPEASPEKKRWIKENKEKYEDIIADLARYDHIAPWSTAGQLAASFGGQLAGSVQSPEAMLGAGAKGATMAWRVAKAALANGTIFGAVDPVVQALSIDAGSQKEFDPWRMLTAAGTGAIIGGGLHWGGEIVGNAFLKNRRVDLAFEDPQFSSAGDSKVLADRFADIQAERERVAQQQTREPEPAPHEPTAPAEAPQAEAPPTAPGALVGEPAPNMEPHRVATADGESIDVSPTVVEADHLIGSGDAGYDAAIQPRDRSRAASDAQIRDMAANLDPERLGYSSEADRGAPIIGPDAMVESGNARVSAIRQAYAENGEAAKRYRDWLTTQGVDVSKYKNPVLVRQRTTEFTPEQRRAFAIGANQGSTLAFSSTERAMADATHVSPEMLDLIRVPGDLGAIGNRDFVRAFVGKLPATERGAMMNAEGGLSAEGLGRVRNAVLGKAYGDVGIMARITESTNDEVKSISNALTAAAPEWAKLRSEIAQGRVRADVDLTPELLEAIERTADLRAKGVKLDEFLAQQDAFDKVSEPVAAWMRLFYDPSGRRAAGAQRISDALKFYAEEARKVSAEMGLDLGLAPVKASDIQRTALEKAHGGDNGAQAGLFEGGGRGNEADTGANAGGDTGRGRSGRATRSGGAGGQPDARDRVAALIARREEAQASDLAQLLNDKAPIEEIEQHPTVVAANREALSLPLTHDLPGYGSAEFRANRVFDFNGERVVGYKAAVEKLTEEARAFAGAKVEQGREATLVIGPPASGKSRLSELIAKNRKAAIIDPDEAKKAMPEFRGGIGANATHEESVTLSARVLDNIIASGDNVVIPRVGANPKTTRDVALALKEAGYKVNLVNMTVDPDEAYRRMIRRFMKTGRMVNGEYFQGVGTKPREAYYALKKEGIFDGTADIDGNARDLKLLDGSGEISGDLEGPGRNVEQGNSRDAGKAQGPVIADKGGGHYLVKYGEPPNDGILSLQLKDDALHVGISSVAEKERGKGIAVALYERALEFAEAHGVPLRSDMSVSADAVRVYEGLRRRGYEVAEAPDSQKSKSGITNSRAGYVFEVKPKTPAGPVASDEIAALARRQSGGVLPMEQARPSGGVPAPGPLAVVPQTPQKDAAIKSLQQQVMELAEALDFPIRQGRIKTKNALAVFNQGGVVRAKEVPDFEAVAHEAGHHIEAKAGQDLTDLMNAHSAELAPLVSNPSAYAPSKYVQEGFAEYIRRFIGNPAWADNQAPTFSAAFRDFMEERHPAIMDALDKAGETYRAYINAPSVDAVHAVVRSQREEPRGLKGAVSKVREEGFPAVIGQVMAKGYETFLDDKADWTRVVRNLTRAIKDKSGQLVDLKAADNPEMLSRLAGRPQQAALHDARDGVRPYHEVEPVGPSLNEAISTAVGEPTVMGKWDDGKVSLFTDYLVARRAEYMWRKFETGQIPNPPVSFSKVDAQRAMLDIEQALPRVREGSDKVHAWTRELLRKQFEGGLIDKSLFRQLQQEEFYVPLMRDLTDKPLAGGAAKGRGAPGDQGPDLIRAFRGSSRDIISPLESLMRQSYLVNRAIQENDVKLALLKLSQEAGTEGGRYAEAIPATEAKKYIFDLPDVIERTAIEHGIDPTEAKVLAGAIGNMSGDDPILGTFFRAEPAGKRGEPIVFYKSGGQTQAMRVMSKSEGFGLYEMLTAAPAPVTDTWIQLVGAAASLKRTGIITNPTFALSNYIRDQFTVGIIRSDYVPIISGLEGLFGERGEFRQGSSAILYNVAGGVAGGASVGAIEHAAEGEINALAKKGYLVNRVTSFKGMLELASSTEAGTRNSVFSKVFDAKKAQGLTDYEAMIEAASQARDILDFNRHGSGTDMVRKFIPFLNAHFQGLDKAKRVMVDPIMKRIREGDVLTTDSADFKNAMNAWIKTFGVGGALGAAYAAMMWEHEAYRDASPYLKGTHIVMPIGNKLALWPKPFELGAGFTAGEYAYQRLYGDDQRAAAQFAQAVFTSLAPPNVLDSIPLVTDVIEWETGKSLFTGRDIVPEQYQRRTASEQYTDRTSALAKWLGKETGQSPIKIEYTIGSMFGTWGRDIMSMSQGLDENTPAANWDNTVFLRRFIKDPTRTSDVTTRYWGHMGQTTGDYNQAVATYDNFNDKFHDDQAKQFLASLDPSQRAYVIAKSAADEDGKPAFNADQKNLHPMVRSYAAVSVLNKLRGELSDNSFKPYATGENLKLDPVARRDLLDNVRELAQMEMRNAFVIMKEPGYQGRPLLDVNGPMDRIRHLSPEVADEIGTRYATAKVYTTGSVAAAYPELQKSLLRDGSEAELSDMAADAKAAGYEFGAERVKKPQKRRVQIQPSTQ